ncbi:methyltransferase family protein [Nocardiopsis sp. Huas11]|uniref:class I SAM-dependent methyltransferase n=1 Tax=Nocardiopsis sp. Huas11 TaxID=2183912 RepID=UPI000EABD4DA|nr:class I SAM-dependent methyltransferase [Nocardiopsis sp. Huas11]RKS08862.1 methyltransferase family protein [Nocardiopsis sp. Huas11]
MDPADFYTGIVADLYGPLKRFAADPDPCEEFVRQVGGPGLELGCGDGDPLIELCRRGLDVEGVDSSAEMVERARARAGREGVSVVVHHQRMEELALPRRYGAIFLAGPTFTLLADDAAAVAALRCVRAHLAPGGQALVPLAVPEPAPEHEVGRVRQVRGSDGAVLGVSVVSQERDEVARTHTSVLRYERRVGGRRTVEERPWVLHWYTRAGFEALAASAGLAVVSVTGPGGGPAGPGQGDVRFRFRLRAR